MKSTYHHAGKCLLPAVCFTVGTNCYMFTKIITVKRRQGENVQYANLKFLTNTCGVYVVIPTQYIYLQVKQVFVFGFLKEEKQSSSLTCACNHYSCALFHFHGWQILLLLRFLRGQILWLRRGRRVWRTAQLRCCSCCCSCLLGVCFSCKHNGNLAFYAITRCWLSLACHVHFHGFRLKRNKKGNYSNTATISHALLCITTCVCVWHAGSRMITWKCWFISLCCISCGDVVVSWELWLNCELGESGCLGPGPSRRVQEVTISASKSWQTREKNNKLYKN